MVASFSLLKAWTMRHPPVVFFTQKVGLKRGEIPSRTWPGRQRPSEKASVALIWSRGSGHFRVTQYFDPGGGAISLRTPRSAGSSAGALSGKTSSSSQVVS
ncbi:hypothetical protein PR003_g10482 [Phytophthora rubi]|uniref:Uncharacterized protein n=1 Tax=Phytophthora rubi TaxID=129364 RepID=A0A6A4FE13_9STRA|nr:hypothetical protein PR001_g12856 [Phytophthora rubi]KAE9340455.1 hypothetical protein PR003_g10482 [Phytophthora rubi]